MNFFNRRIAPPQRDHFEVMTEHGPIAVTVRRHARARNYTLRLASAGGGAVLTMPLRGSLSAARVFLDRHTGWLARQMRKAPPARPIADGTTIPLRDVPHLIRHAPGRRGTVTVGGDDTVPTLFVAGAPEHLRRRVLDFLKREARRDIEPAVMRHAASLRVTASAIKLRDQTSRWGSCSPTGTLSFSWRLVMAPPFVLDYLAAHEVAHLREMNHSRRFWRLVEEVCPETETARAWLNHHGPSLHAVGALATGPALDSATGDGMDDAAETA